MSPKASVLKLRIVPGGGAKQAAVKTGDSDSVERIKYVRVGGKRRYVDYVAICPRLLVSGFLLSTISPFSSISTVPFFLK